MRKFLLFSSLILFVLSCDQENKVHDPQVYFLDTGGDYYYLEEGNGPNIVKGQLVEVSFQSMDEMMEGEGNSNPEHKSFNGFIRLENVHFPEYQELYSNLKVGDKVMATFTKGSSVEVSIISMKALVAQKQDSITLVEFYNATNGGNWKLKWDMKSPVTEWAGVSLNNDGYVTAISLEDNNINGSLPLSLSKLPFLSYINLEKNSLKGNLYMKSFGGRLYSYDMEKSMFDENQLQEFKHYFLQDSFLLVSDLDSFFIQRNDSFNLISNDSLKDDENVNFYGYKVINKSYASQKYSDKNLVLPNKLLSVLPVLPPSASIDLIKSKLHLVHSYKLESGFKMVGNEFIKDESLLESEEQEGVFEKYEFERGIKINISNGYESMETIIRYPKHSFDMYDIYQRTIPFFPQEVKGIFLENNIYKMPTSQMDTIMNYNRLNVELNDKGEIMTFSYGAEECGDWYHINSEEDEIIVNFGGGC